MEPTAVDWPLFSAAAVVCRECLPANGGALPHVTRCVSDFLDSLSRHGTFAASCRRGDSARELSYLFARDPTPLTQQMVREAARNGHTHVLKWLKEHDDDRRNVWKDYDFSPMDEAAKFGHLHTMQWLHENRNDCYAGRAMSWAATNGHLEMVQWLHSNRDDFCGTFAMDFAAANGHLEVLQWLHCNRSDGCTTWAMDGAAQNNHLDVVQWLHSNRREGCTKAAIGGAAARGHLTVVKWFLENAASNDGMHWWGWAFTAAVDNGQVDVARWIYATFRDRMTDSVIRSALSTAEDKGHEMVVQWLRMEQHVR